MAENLVIVESPTKARTVGQFLGSKYTVKASLGHVRDLPKSQMGVDVDNDFTPKYLVPREKKAVVKELKDLVQKATTVFLATDPDREGEAISWHLMHATGLNEERARRVVFHEITREAVNQAFRHPRAIDMQLVQAQQARRILDRLVGYKLSPLLWKKVRGRLSAGRVQSVALRLIVDREREIQAFSPLEYWTIEAELAKRAEKGVRRRKEDAFRAVLVGPFGDKEKTELRKEAEARAVESLLRGATYAVAEVKDRQIQRQPAAPFTTSTLQQEAFRKLRFPAKRTMAVAQQLYEGVSVGRGGSVGLITYMRTDSTQVATSAIGETRGYIKERYGADYLPESPRLYTRRARGAQEAHEAIRPTSVHREPEAMRRYLSSEQLRLYDLIWKRMVASQMSPAILDSTTVDVKASPAGGAPEYLLRATGSSLRFAGFLAVYQEGKDEAEAEDDDGSKKRLPLLVAGEPLDLRGIFADQHWTQPPPRYTDASLVKVMEEQGIGRPSTYAPILSTLQERGYVEKMERKFLPTELGFIVNDLLVEHFPNVVDVGFTAQLEEELDEIAQGEREWVQAIRGFYGPFERSVHVANQQMPEVKVEDERTGEACEKCGRPLVIKWGRYGKFVACSGFPECRNAKPFLVKVGVRCPRCGEGDIVEKKTRKRRLFYGCSRYPACDFTVWNRPVPQSCPQCGGLMTASGRRTAKCTQCDYSGSIPAEGAVAAGG